MLVEHLDGTCRPRVDIRRSPDGTETPCLDHRVQPGPGHDRATNRRGKLQERGLQLLDALVSACSVEVLARALRTVAFRAQVVQLSYERNGE
jgi:hypothetical protein